MKLDDSISAVVTGGASGLGLATVEALRAQGVKVAIFDLNEELVKRQLPQQVRFLRSAMCCPTRALMRPLPKPAI